MPAVEICGSVLSPHVVWILRQTGISVERLIIESLRPGVVCHNVQALGEAPVTRELQTVICGITCGGRLVDALKVGIEPARVNVAAGRKRPAVGSVAGNEYCGIDFPVQP